MRRVYALGHSATDATASSRPRRRSLASLLVRCRIDLVRAIGILFIIEAGREGENRIAVKLEELEFRPEFANLRQQWVPLSALILVLIVRLRQPDADIDVVALIDAQMVFTPDGSLLTRSWL